MPGILSGIKVVAFTHYAAGPLTAQFVGSLGADVVKIESPFKDLNRYAVYDPEKLQGVSPYYLALNRNQRAIALNLKSDHGKEVARRLIQKSDVLIENFKPGVLDRLGFGYDDVKIFNERLIYCSISGFDLLGPSCDKPGQDLLIQAQSGLAAITGRDGGPPVPVGTYAIDSHTALLCVIGILAALRHREVSGEGQWVRCDMTSSALFMMAQEASYVMNIDSNQKRSRSGVAHVDQSAPYAIYETRDGAFAMSISPAEKVKLLAENLGVWDRLQPFFSDRGLHIHRDEITAVLMEAFRKLSTAEALQLSSDSGILTARVRTLAEALEDPGTVAGEVVRKVDSAYGGQYRVVVEPLKMSQSPLTFSRPAAGFGENTDEVLCELGYSQEDINELKLEKTVLGPER